MPNKKISNKTHISRTDPDASLARKNGAPQKLKYKVHNAIDAKSRVIIDTHVTIGKVHESQILLKRRNVLKKRYVVPEVIADRGYGSLEILLSLKKEGVSSYIPLFSSKSGSSKVNLEDFTYDAEKDQFTCSQGAVLKERGHIYDSF